LAFSLRNFAMVAAPGTIASSLLNVIATSLDLVFDIAAFMTPAAFVVAISTTSLGLKRTLNRLRETLELLVQDAGADRPI
jgi:hypothetical protein